MPLPLSSTDALPSLYRLHLDARREAARRLVDGVVHDLPQNVVQPLHARRTDVHAGAQAHRVQPFEDLYVLGIIVILLFRHKNLFLFKKCVPICDIVPYFALFFKEIGGGNTIFRSSAAWFSEAAPFRAEAASSPHARRTLLLAYRSRSSALRAPSRIDPAPPLYAHHRVSIPLLRFTRTCGEKSALPAPPVRFCRPVFTPPAQTARKILKACVFLLTNVPENDIVIKRAGA